MNPFAHGNFSGRRLVVLGAGYVGGAVARQAAAAGLQVTALTRNAAKAEALRAAGITTIEADLAGPDWQARVPAEADFVLNSVSSGGGGVAGYQHSYVDGMRAVAAWTRSGRIGTLVYTSSTSVYPQGGGARVDERAPTEPAGERASLLLAAEALALGAQRPAGGADRCFVLRLAGIYGPGRHHILDQLRAGEALAGTGEHLLNLAHRDDIAAAIVACFRAPLAVTGGIFNVADDEPATKAELAAWLATRLGLPPPRFDPTAVSRRRADVPDRVILNGKLKQQLGWRAAYPGFRAGYENLLSR